MTREEAGAGFSRPLTHSELRLMWSPHAMITLVMRLRGRVGERAVQEALDKVSQRHILLQCRVASDGRGAQQFTTEGSGGVTLQSFPRTAEDQWIREVRELSQMPFDLGARPAARVLLLEAQRATDIIIQCHRVLADAPALAWLGRDLLTCLSNPALVPEVLPNPVPPGGENLPQGARPGALERMRLRQMNRRWRRERVVFGQEDYRTLHRAYWARYPHQVLAVEWDEAETAGLLERCRNQRVTVEAALMTAFGGAQQQLADQRRRAERVALEVDLRSRLPQPPGEALISCSTEAQVALRYDARVGFWENVRRLQERMQPLLAERELFGGLLRLENTDPTLL